MRSGAWLDTLLHMPTKSLATEDPGAGSLLTRVPGRSTPRAQIRKEFDEGVDELKRRCPPALWAIFVAKAEEMYRWRTQLGCGCVREVLTGGKDSTPTSAAM